MLPPYHRADFYNQTNTLFDFNLNCQYRYLVGRIAAYLSITLNQHINYNTRG